MCFFMILYKDVPLTDTGQCGVVGGASQKSVFIQKQ